MSWSTVRTASARRLLLLGALCATGSLAACDQAEQARARRDAAALAARAAIDAQDSDAARPGATHSEPWFHDATEESGLAFQHREGGEQWDIRPTMGPGAAWSDVDGDGDPDLYVVGGSEQSGALFVNDGTGHFQDEAEDWGLTGRGAGMGAVFADWDEDGDPDLYVTNDGPNAMHRNVGGRFTDVTSQAGTGDPRWGASAAFADTDRDGDLDLYVANYLEFDLALIPPESEVSGQRREDPIAMLPYVFPGQPNVFYRNQGDGRFSDATKAAGLWEPEGKSLGAVFMDHDDDGWPDLYVANDTTPNSFWHNQGDGRFEEISLFVGLDDPRGGMGLAPADMDADGDEDVLLTNWQLEPNALYRNNHVHAPSGRRFVARFEDLAVHAGLAQPSVGYVGWGCVLTDLDNDGDADVYVANGYTSPDYETTMICVGQQDQLFENVTAPGSLREHRDTPRWRAVPAVRSGNERALPSRGLAAADADGDGDLDLAVTTNNGPLVFLRNERGGRSLRVVPVGRAVSLQTANDASAAAARPGSPRDALGARVTLELDDGTQRLGVVRAGSSYLGQHQRGVHFGLGERSARMVRVRWPDGSESEHGVHGEGVLEIVQP